MATVEGPEQSQEGDGDLIFDAGNSYDPFWGKDSLNYIWTLIKIESTGNYMVDNSEEEAQVFLL